MFSCSSFAVVGVDCPPVFQSLVARIGVQPSLVSYGTAMLASNRLGRWEAWKKNTAEFRVYKDVGWSGGNYYVSTVYIVYVYISVYSVYNIHLSLRFFSAIEYIYDSIWFSISYTFLNNDFFGRRFQETLALLEELRSSGYYPDGGCLHAARLAAKEAGFTEWSGQGGPGIRGHDLSTVQFQKDS